MSLSKPHNRALAIGFYVNWDDSSYTSLRRALPALDWVIPTWMTVGGPNTSLSSDIDSKALGLIRSRKRATPILPLLQNTFEGKWDGAGLAQMLEDPATRQARISEIVDLVATNHLQGVTVDFEEVPPASHPALKLFLSELKRSFQPHGWGIVLAVPFDDANWDYAGYAKIVDFELLMGYDQHWGGKKAGSIAAKDWFERTLQKRMKQLDPDQTIIALGSYGYDWATGSNAEVLTFEDALRRAANSQANISFDSKTQNPHYSYNDHAGVAHQVWFLDGVTAYNQIHAADSYKPYAYAVWRLGAEDPSIWPLLGREYGTAPPSQLSRIDHRRYINGEAPHEMLQIASSASAPVRVVEPEPQQVGMRDEKDMHASNFMTRSDSAPRKISAVDEKRSTVLAGAMLPKIYEAFHPAPEG